MDLIKFTQSLLRCPSITPEDAGAQTVLIDALEPMGFRTFKLPFKGDGSYPVDNFFARLGTQGPHLCFAGHTDVVPPGDAAAWTHPPFSAEIVDGKIYARGASDMKGNICAFVAAVYRFLAGKKSFKGSISLLITGDEEADAINGTDKVLAWMARNGHTPDVAIVGEPTNPDALGEEIKVGRRGSLSGYLSVRGVQGHVAYQHRADNPLPRLIRLLNAIDSHEYDRGSGYFPPTNLEITSIDVGNTADNVIPALGTAKFNLRFSDQWTGASLSKKIREILDSVSKDYDLRLEIGAESFLTERSVWTDLVAGAVKDVTQKTPALTTNGGTSDARFIRKYCPVVEFGLTNRTVHQVNEHLAVSELEMLTAVYKRILERYFS